MQVSGLALGYDKKVVAKDISFSLKPGDYLCIIGENGTGKSTFVKTLLGLHKPIAGKIELGVERTRIGYLPQQEDIQRDFPASVREIVATGCLAKMKWWQAFYTKKEQELVDGALEATNITELGKSCYRELSGGQQQRVLLARALITAEEMFVLDEPTASLDPACAAEIYSVLERINRDKRVTVIMVSHDVNTALKYATHILCLKKDSYFFGTTKEFRK